MTKFHIHIKSAVQVWGSAFNKKNIFDMYIQGLIK